MPTEKRVPSLIVNTLTEAQYQALENPSDTEMWVTPYDESILPDQTGQSGKFLTTDGTDASWADVDTLPSQSGQSGKFLTTDGTDASWASVSAPANVYTQDNLIAGTGISFTSVITTDYTVVGSPTITNGVASGFSDSNYVKATNALNNVTSSFTLQTAINLTVSSDSNYGIIDTGGSGNSTGIRLTTNSSNGIHLRISTNGTQTYAVDINSTNPLTLNTKTFIKVTYNSSTGYELYMSLDGKSWTLEATSSATTKPYSSASDLVIGDNIATGYALNGSIYLGDTYIDVDGSRVWTAYEETDTTQINSAGMKNEATADTSLNILGLTSNPNYLSRANVVVLGKDAYAQGTRETIIGYGAHSGYYTNNTGNVVIGYNAQSTSAGDVVIGDTAKASADAVSVGKSSEALSSSVSVGNSAISKADNAVCLGYNAHNDSSSGNSIAIGKGATVSSGFNGMAIGASSTASASGAIQIGAGTNSTANSVQIDTYQVFDRSTGKIPAARMPITVADTSLSNLTAAGKDIGAELSFPAANSYTDLVLGASGATYTAANNGYLVFGVSSTTAALAYVTVTQGDMSYQQVWFANNVNALYPGGAIPITKGTFQINYGNIAGMSFLRLFYNQGNNPS